MYKRALFLLFIALVFQGLHLTATASSRQSFTGAAVIREMNLARESPARYATYLQAMRGNFQGDVFRLPSGAFLRTREGVSAVDEAVRFLRTAQPLGPLTVSPGMSHAAADHVRDQADGSFGHGGSDRSNPAARLIRYGTWSGLWGENISYGKSTARDIVMALIIDDGQRARKHRKNIFNPAFNFGGAAVGPHARYRTVCSIEFAGGYAERGESASEPLFARN
ncbi:MAG: CAP domain-containing protein [Chthoniobacterales bacterium]|nr:CAP domain-containing protein [Chthoniobacterales bacterium]